MDTNTRLQAFYAENKIKEGKDLIAYLEAQGRLPFWEREVNKQAYHVNMLICPRCLHTGGWRTHSAEEQERIEDMIANGDIDCSTCHKPMREMTSDDDMFNAYGLQTTRLELLRTMPYQAYLQTPEWEAKRLKALRRADHHCELCFADQTLHVHHKTYERRGDERLSDLIVLCDRCHARFHDILPEA